MLNRYFLRSYRFQFFWIGSLVLSTTIVILTKQFLFSYQNIEPITRGIYVLGTTCGFSFVTIFIIFSFTKIYQKGKKSIEKSIEQDSFSARNFTIFVAYSALITTILVLMIRTGTTDYASTIFPQIKDVINTVASFEVKDLGALLGIFLNNDIIFRYTFSSMGVGILLLLRYLHLIKNEPEKFPGTRTLMLFFFLSFFGIFIRLIIPTDPFELLQTLTILIFAVITTTIFTSLAYLFDKLIFTKLAKHT